MSARPAERICDRAYQALFCFAPPQVREELGLRSFEHGPLFAGFAPRVDVPALNRVLGLGRAPDSFELLVRALAWVRAGGASQAVLPVLTSPTGARAGAWLLDQGLDLYGSRMRVSARLDLVSHPVSLHSVHAFRVGAIPASELDSHTGLISAVLGLPAAAAAWIASMREATGWRHFGAYVNGRMAGAASMFVEGSACSLAFEAVPLDGRAHGMRGALLAARLQAARASGCNEVGLEIPEGLNREGGEDGEAGEGIPLAELAAWGFDRACRETLYRYLRPGSGNST